MHQIILPELGEGITSVEISDVLVNVGDSIEIDDIMIVVETEKASMEIPTTEGGTISDVHVNKGDTLEPGQPIITVSGDASGAAETNALETVDEPEVKVPSIENSLEATPEPPPVIPKTEPEPRAEHPAEADPGSNSAKASPGVRRFARELGCNLDLVTGTGSKSRITKEDVQIFIKQTLHQPLGQHNAANAVPSKPDIDFTQWGEVNRTKLNKIKRITGIRLQESWQSIPHVTQFDKADVTDLEKLRKSLKQINKKTGINVSMIPFFMKAAVNCLKALPIFNSSLSNDGQELILKKYYNIGVAVDTPNGLVVPVIRNVDRKSIKRLTVELTQLSAKARDGKLTPADMQGGCFTISSLGGVGGTYFTPIINPPEVGILGISHMQVEPVYKNKKFKARQILPYSLSYDHRVIDGVAATTFTRKFAESLQDLSTLV